MTGPTFALLEIVKLKHALQVRGEAPCEERPLAAGALGTVCEMGKSAAIGHVDGRTVNVHKWIFWVEFTDDDGKTLAVLPLEAEDLEKA